MDFCLVPIEISKSLHLPTFVIKHRSSDQGLNRFVPCSVLLMRRRCFDLPLGQQKESPLARIKEIH